MQAWAASVPACLFVPAIERPGPTGTPRPVGSPGAACQRSLAEFAPAGAKKIKLVFGRDMCVTKTLPASVGFVRFSWTNPARNGLHPSRKSGIGAFSTVQGPGCTAAQPGPVLMRAEDCRWREGRVCTAASVGACRGQPSAGRLLDGGVTREGGRTSSIKRCWTACKTVQHRLNLFKQTQAPAAVKQPGPYLARETVSRVLYLTVIYLDAPLPTRSSHLLRTAGPAICPFHGVAPDRVYSDGHFRAVGCALTAPFHPYRQGYALTVRVERSRSLRDRVAAAG